ncbi:MAG: penicillin-binding protein activator [Massilia sp.]
MWKAIPCGLLALLAACSTPCDAPGGLCAPLQPNTSSVPAHPRAAEAPVQVVQEPRIPPAKVETAAIDMPGATPLATAPATGTPIRIALLLPMKSDTLGPPADALRAGFMAGYERDRTGFIVNLIETGGSPEEALDAFLAAQKDNDIIVGPLARPAVSAVAVSGAVSKPTVALNHPEGRGEGAIPPQMVVIGLSIEDEARQVADWAAAEYPGANALIVSGTSSWQRRIAGAFSAQWKQSHGKVQLAELGASNGYLSEAGINQLKLRVDTERPTLIFAALDADQLRQVRNMLGPEIPMFGTSSVNPGSEPGSALADFDGVRLLDMPWQVQRDNAAVMVYPRWQGGNHTLDMERLYALGIDAYRVARQLALSPGAPFQMDGVTGHLSLSYEGGRAHFSRAASDALVQGGAFKLVEPGR